MSELNALEPVEQASPREEAVGRQLRALFDSLTASPPPARLVELADALEAAYARGALAAPLDRAS